MDISIEQKDDVVVCVLSGELDLYAAPSFHARYMENARRAPSCHFVMDFGRVSYIDSSGIGVLFQMYSNTRDRKRKFCLCNVGGMVLKLLELSRMTAILPIEQTLDRAVSAVRKPA
jgi:stage II sporulation protein AA (anti-sigma F factor antagonist)